MGRLSRPTERTMSPGRGMLALDGPVEALELGGAGRCAKSEERSSSSSDEEKKNEGTSDSFCGADGSLLVVGVSISERRKN